MKLLKRLVPLLLVLMLIFPAQSAHADMAPPPAPLLTGLEPFQYQNTQVQMVYERVEMEPQTYQASDQDHKQSRVTVKISFVMRNQGHATESMQSIFPLESLTECSGYMSTNNYSYTYYSVNPDSFEIAVDGEPVTTQKVTTPHPYKDNPQFSKDVCAEMHWIGFNVTFPVNTDVVVTVSYNMDARGTDAMQNIDYVLETGAGWHGPIERAYVVVKFPYVVSQQNVLADTTPGYQMLYNEIFWSFQNFEPTPKDNLRVSIVSPGTWQTIQADQRLLDENPALPETWFELAQIYAEIAYGHIPVVRSEYYAKKMEATFNQGLAANPQSADLYAQIAIYKINNGDGLKLIRSTSQFDPILALISKSLALDPQNESAQTALRQVKDFLPDLTFTPPPTLPPTATAALSSTPTRTPVPSFTPRPSLTPVVVSVVNTVIVTATPARPDATRVLSPTPTTSLPTATRTPAPQNPSGINWIAWPLLFVLGLCGGIFITKKKLI